MESPKVARPGERIAQYRPGAANIMPEGTKMLALDIRVSDDGERCTTRISVEQETTGEQHARSAPTDHSQSNRDDPNGLMYTLDAVAARGCGERDSVAPEAPASPHIVHAEQQPVEPERSQNIETQSAPRSKAEGQAQGDEENQQPLTPNRYDDSSASTPTPSDAPDDTSPRQASCEVHTMATADQGRCRPEQDEQPTLTFLQERLESKAAEISGLREEVRRLRESRLCLDALPSGRASAEDDTVCISAAELAAMKKDMEEQERLIAGYGEANRSAAVQVKDLETRLKAKDAAMVEERAALERDLVRAVEAQKHRSADTADKLRRIFELESQLAGVREQAETKEAELRNALDVARQEKKALEDNASTWEAHAVTEGDQLVQQVRDEMHTVKAQYEEHVAGLTEKLEWHVQKLADCQAVVREQESTISGLQVHVRDIPTIKAAQQQVAELTEQLQGLQKSMADDGWNKAGPLRLDNISKHDQVDIETLRAELKKVRAKAAEAEVVSQTQYRTLEKRHAQLIAASVEGGDAGAVAAKEELQRLRQRLQTMQAMLDAERGRRPGSGLAESSSTTTLEDVTNTPRHSEDGVGGARTSSGLTKQWVRLRQQLAEARQTILAKDSLVSRLHQQLQQGQMRQDQGMHVPEGQLGGLHKEIQELRGLLERQGERQVELQGDVRAATEARRRAEQACDDAVRQAEAEAADLRLQVAQLTARQEASQAMVVAVQQASSAAAGALQEVRSQHAAELKRLAAANDSVVSAAAREAAAVEARKGSERCLQLEGQLGHASQRAAALEQELQEVRHSKVWAPSAREIVALENQVRDMSLQLSSQRQQWLAVTSCSPQPAATLAGLRGSPSLKLSHAAQQMLSPGSVAKGDALILDQSMDVQAKIEYLQKQVDSVIEVAAVLQQSRHEEGTPAPAAQPSVEV